MIIVRDGKEIKLTKDELIRAYDEQQELYDIEFVEENVSDYLYDDQEELAEDEGFVTEVALDYRHYILEGYDESDALEKAVEDVVPSYE